MVRLTGQHLDLYRLLQAKAKAELSRVSGVEVGDLADNETLARDVGNLRLDTVTELIKRHSSAGRVW
jgi:hypothetical protein